MYRKFRDDPSSVDPSWHDFLVDYSPEPTGNGQQTSPADTQTTAKPAETVEEPTAAGQTKAEPIQEAKPVAKTLAVSLAADDEAQVLRGAAATVVKNMSASLD